jgi:hypothetical protein
MGEANSSATRGIAHERRYLEKFKAEGREVLEIAGGGPQWSPCGNDPGDAGWGRGRLSRRINRRAMAGQISSSRKANVSQDGQA